MSRISDFLGYSCQRSTVVRAVKVASVITPILTVINHYGEIAAWRMGPGFWGQAGLTFLVPYFVSTYSSAMTTMEKASKAEPGVSQRPESAATGP